MLGDRPAGPRLAWDLRRWGDEPALIESSGRMLTYNELADRADRFAGGLGPAIRYLAIEARSTVEAVIAYVGAMRAGVPVFLHVGTSASEPALRACPPDARYGFGDDAPTGRLAHEPVLRAPRPHPDLAIVLPTSGSTGSSKLVRLSAANVQANAEAIAAYLGLSASERAITSLPLSYCYGLSVLNAHLSVGASIVLTSESVSSSAFRDLVAAHEVTSVAGVPHSYELMDRCGLLANPPPSLRTFTQAGGRMEPQLISRVLDQIEPAGARLFVMYGQTEATARMAFLPPERLRGAIDCIGGPVPGGELWVEDEDGARLQPGAPGALVYRGPNVMMGYASNRAELSAPAGGDVLRTGDLAVEVEPGMFRITGRESRFVKPFGLRISLDELETRLLDGGVAAIVTGDDRRIVIAAALERQAVARETVGSLGLPAETFVFLPLSEIPRLDGGKPDYPALLRLGLAADARDNATGSIEDLFRRLAKDRPLDADDTFQTLGGDSLSYVQCCIALETELGFLPDFWEEMTLGELRALAARGATRRRPGFVTIEPVALVRGVVILLVVSEHAMVGLPIREQLGTLNGGAHVLMLLVGLSWYRFQRGRLLQGQIWPTYRDFALRYLSFFYAVVVAFSLWHAIKTGGVNWGPLLLVGAYKPERMDLIVYWFLENLAWIAAAMCLLFASPRVREYAQKHRKRFGAALVAAGVAAYGIGVLVRGGSSQHYLTPEMTFVYFAAGWMLATTHDWRTRLTLVVGLQAMAVLSWGWGDSHWVAVGLAGAVLTFCPRFQVRTAIATPLLALSGATFFIYHANTIVLFLQMPEFSHKGLLVRAFSVVLTLAAAFAAKWLVENRTGLWSRLKKTASTTVRQAP